MDSMVFNAARWDSVRFSRFLRKRYFCPRKRSCSLTSAFRTSSTATPMIFMMWYLSKVISAFGRLSSTPLMKAGDMSMETSVISAGFPWCS